MPPQLSNTPSGNQNQFFGQKVSRLGINVNSAGDSDLIYKNDFSTTLYYDESGVPTVLLGLRNTTGRRGLYVSQTGVDVTTANDSQLIFNSDQDIFKIVKTGFIVNTIGGTLSSGATNTVSVAHGLNFLPGVMGFLNGTGSSYLVAGTYYQTPYVVAGLFGGTWQPGVSYSFSVDSQNVYANIKNNTSVGISDIGTTVFKYYLLQETAS